LYSDIQLAITANIANTGDVSVTIPSGTAPFTVVSGNGVVSLGPGDTVFFTVRYVPTDYGTDIGTLSITHDADSPASPFDIDLSGVGVRFIEYSLPIIYKCAAGTLKLYLYVDPSLPVLTIPTITKIFNLGKFKELIDFEAGVVDIQQVDTELIEEYSTYPEGFWYKIINGYPTKDVELMFTLMEGAVWTFLFRGRIYRSGTIAIEKYITASTKVRGMGLQLISSLDLLKTVTISDLITECRLHTIYSAAFGQYVIPLGTIVACMIKLAYGIAYDSTLVINNSDDVKVYIEGGGAENTWDIAALPIEDGSHNLIGFFEKSTGNTAGWYNRFANAFDLLFNIIKPFGVIPKYMFGDVNGLIDANPTNNNHRLIFDSRGRSAGEITMVGGIKDKESELLSESVLKAQNVRVMDFRYNILSYWYLNDVLQKGDTPPFATFDIDFSVDFQVYYSIDMPTWDLILYDDYTGTYNSLATACLWWNYSTGGWGIVTGYGSDNCLAKGSSQYYKNRFANGRTQYTRTYKSIKANNGSSDSHRWLQTLKRHVINDGVTPRTYYLTSLEKDIGSNESSAVLVEE
jgi:hypothetical protein